MKKIHTFINRFKCILRVKRNKFNQIDSNYIFILLKDILLITPNLKEPKDRRKQFRNTLRNNISLRTSFISI